MKKIASDDALDRALTDLYQTDVPAGYRAAWRDAVKREEPPEMKPIPSFARLKRAALPVAAAVVLIAGTLITGALNPKTTSAPPSADTEAQAFSNNAYKTASIDAGYGYGQSEDVLYAPMPAAAYLADTTAAEEDRATGGVMASETAQKTTGEAADETGGGRKIVRSVTLTLSSAAFDRDYDAVLSLTESAGGYASAVNMSEQQVSKRSAWFELRIPAENLDDFLGGLAGIGRVTDRSETATDLTTQYADTELRLSTQQDKMARLQELLLQAETVEDLLEIEREIADTQYEIDSLQSSMLRIDRQVDYATVSVYLREQTPADTAAAEDLTVGERVVNGLQATLSWLGGFFENMLVFLIAAAPVLVPLVALYIILRIVRKRRKSNRQS